ncbi:hypothetical protein HY570_01140 [Candidatus Micrarchaeota archaeon]|nr:hypothetical protein [Candidatus Micrarchaeota archaeon]
MISKRRMVAIVLPIVLYFLAFILILALIGINATKIIISEDILLKLPLVVIGLIGLGAVIAFVCWTLYAFYLVVRSKNPNWWKAIWLFVILLGIFVSSLGGLVYFILGDFERMV